MAGLYRRRIMTDLPLTKISETTKNITLGWTPVLCIGYVFYVNGKRVSNTWNSVLSQVTFSKSPGAIYRVQAVGVNASGTYPPATLPNVETYSGDPYGTGLYTK
jgi:hypothetical protein